jgi:phi13 family phage major tail protein
MPTQVGLSDLHYAVLTADTAGNIAYDTPVKIPGAIEVTINPNTSTETLFADNGPMETASTLGEIEVEVNVADLPLDAQKVLFGHTVGSDGVLLRKGADAPPFVAIGFKSLKSNGKYRYVWLTKGKFGLPELNSKTKEDSIEFQTPTVSASFVKREADDVWMATGDEDDVAFTTAAEWFTQVFGETGTAA